MNCIRTIIKLLVMKQFVLLIAFTLALSAISPACFAQLRKSSETEKNKIIYEWFCDVVQIYC